MALSYERNHRQQLILIRPEHCLDDEDLVALFDMERDRDPPRILDLRAPFLCHLERHGIHRIIANIRADFSPAARTAIVASSAALFGLAQEIALSVNRRGPRRAQRVRAFSSVVDANEWLGKDPWDDLERLRANLGCGTVSRVGLPALDTVGRRRL